MTSPKFRHPDKPQQIYTIEQSAEEWLCQAKIDGYRCVVQMQPDGGVTVVSRVNEPLDVSEHVLEAFKELGLPPHTWLDGEWVKRRKATRQQGIPERIYLFGSFYWAGEWTGSATEQERWEEVANLPLRDPLYLPSHETEDIESFAQATVDDWLTEGVVLKHREARLIGDLRSCKKNPLYLKWKWREGCDGANTSFLK